MRETHRFFALGARVRVTLYPVDSTLVGETGSVRSVRGRYGRRGSEASTGAMLASPGEYLYEVALDEPPANKPRSISVRESGLRWLHSPGNPHPLYPPLP